MKKIGSAIIAASFVIAAAAFAQSTPAPTSPPPAATSAPPDAPAVQPSGSAAAVPVASGRRYACRTASQGMRGQEQRDQMQLCMAQARMDCLKQAIDQKIVGPQRKEFIRTCAE